MSRMFTKKPASESATCPDETSGPAVLTPEQLWARALSWQTRREHSRAELAEKLARLGAEADQVEAVLARLGELGLQSDDRFADLLVRGQLRRGRGQRLIRQTLQQRGIAPDHPALLAQGAAVDWVEQARALLVRRFGEDLSREPRERARYVRFLQYRGFSLAQSLAAMGAGDPDD